MIILGSQEPAIRHFVDKVFVGFVSFVSFVVF